MTLVFYRDCLQIVKKQLSKTLKRNSVHFGTKAENIYSIFWQPGRQLYRLCKMATEITVNVLILNLFADTLDI